MGRESQVFSEWQRDEGIGFNAQGWIVGKSFEIGSRAEEILFQIISEEGSLFELPLSGISNNPSTCDSTKKFVGRFFLSSQIQCAKKVLTPSDGKTNNF